MKVQYVLEGSDAVISATVYAHPQVDEILWYHDNNLVDPSSEQYSTSSDGSALHIKGVDENLQGRYQIVVRVGNETASDETALVIPGTSLISMVHCNQYIQYPGPFT